jgi:DNA-binding HxlR family transcriptional regulator
LQEAAEKLFQSEKQLQELRFEVDKSISQRALEATVKTMRRTGLYGYG